jgi:putative peptide-modifying radical SAM enzyme
MPSDITYDLESLQQFIKKDANAIVAFYGGEPLLRPHVVKHFLDVLTAKHFVINSNGYFIESICDVISRFDTILLSIDGREKITDRYRENGCYQQVMHAVDVIHDSSFHGELIARMAVSEHTDIYEDVTHLLQYFPLVHWQLDVVWSALWGLDEFKTWVEKSYKPGLKKLISNWVEKIKTGQVTGIIPFRGIMTRLLYDISGLPCEAGENAVAITTDGQILACPIAPGHHWNDLGNISTGFQQVHVDTPCPSCEVYSICGGRCLFANKERYWGMDGFNAICDVTKFLINELQRYQDICEPLKEQIRYPPYNNTTEIIP